jgi:hypothetical protein
MRRLLLLASALSLMLLSGAQAAEATPGSGTFHWDAGAGAVCGVEATACPDVAMASNGDTFSLRGQGDLDTTNGAASGGGTFEHRDSAGNLLASGTLTASGLLTYVSYGCDTNGFPASFCGGRAALAVHLVATTASGATVEADGILEVTCLIGKPPAGVMEGIRMNVNDLINFNKSVRGDTLFIKTT